MAMIGPGEALREPGLGQPLGGPVGGGPVGGGGRLARRGDGWRSFSTAARLGWAMEANWTDPVLFFVYSVAKPVSAALILVVMLQVIGGASSQAYRGFVVVGSALWSFVVAGIGGLPQAILDDRERYRMLKYVYVSPSALSLFLFGRGVARIAVGAMGTIVTLAVGVVVLGVRFDPAGVAWPMLAVVTAGGVVTIVMIGVTLVAVCLQTRQDSWSYPEAVAGALFLVSGAVFPLAVLPLPVQWLGLADPLAWWLEATRLALFGATTSGIGGPGSLWLAVTGTAAPTPAQAVAALLVTGAVGTLGAMLAFRASEGRAKDRGLLDRTTGS